MTIISEEIDYVIFFIGASLTIIILLFGISKKTIDFLNKISNIPNELSNLKQKYTNTHEDVQTLKEKIFRIDGQMQIYSKFVNQLITGEK